MLRRRFFIRKYESKKFKLGNRNYSRLVGCDCCLLDFWIFGGLESPSLLNELGDFLAGIFAPVAFFWLILGYVQQGKQLDQNTKALEQQERALQLQIDEMRESVKQQGKLAELRSEQIKMTHNAHKPYLELYSPILNIHDVNDLLTGKPEKLCSLVFYIRSAINESRFISLMTMDEAIYQREKSIQTDGEVEFTLRLDFLGDQQINEFLQAKKNECEIQFKIKFQNIYGLETENIYLYRIHRYETGDMKVLKPILRDSLIKSSHL